MMVVDVTAQTPRCVSIQLRSSRDDSSSVNNDLKIDRDSAIDDTSGVNRLLLAGTAKGCDSCHRQATGSERREQKVWFAGRGYNELGGLNKIQDERFWRGINRKCVKYS